MLPRQHKKGVQMRTVRHIRLLTAIALAVPISLATLAFAGPAFADGTATCSKLSGSVSSNKASLSGCTDTANTGGSGTVSVTTLESGKGPITWASSHGTTTISITFTQSGTSCPSATEYKIAGKVTADTGKAKSIKVGGKVSADVCLSKTDTFSLVKGTKFAV